MLRKNEQYLLEQALSSYCLIEYHYVHLFNENFTRRYGPEWLELQGLPTSLQYLFCEITVK